MTEAGGEALDTSRKRLTYLMLFRVGVVSLLLVAALLAELGESANTPTSPLVTTLLGLIAATYALTIVFALVLKRARRIAPLAAAQIATDLLLTTALVHLTGGADSGFVFMYLLVVVGASFVARRGAWWGAAGAASLYIFATALDRSGWLPHLAGTPLNILPLRSLFRTLTVNVVAIVGIGALGARLAVELERAGERIESQGLRLRDLAALHQDVIRCLSSGLITIGRDDRVLTYNAAASEILGVPPPPAAAGRRVDELMPSLRPLLDATARGEALKRGELVHHRPSAGSRVLGVSLSPLVDSGGALLGRIVNFQDVTQLRELETAMARSERLAAVGRLAAGVAHEIRNPLAAISGSIELLSQSTPAGSDSGELMAIVLREVARLNALITELLEFARPRAPEVQPIDLQAALNELLRVAENDKQLDGARVELKAPSVVWVEADPGQLRQIVWNLLRNAAEASPKGAPITVELSGDEADWARLTVCDRGPGIAPEHRPRVFEPFFSTKEGGTGLGLATVHRIIEEHHGRIEIGDAPGGGAAVIVRLPKKTESAQAQVQNDARWG